MTFKAERRRQIYVKRYYDSTSSGEEALRKAKISLQNEVVKLNKLLDDVEGDTSGIVSPEEKAEVAATITKFNNWIIAIVSALDS